MNYWEFNGKNGLRGYFDDDGTPNTDNPPVLSDKIIAYALQTSREAREEFNQIYPYLQPEEQARLDDLVDLNPHATDLIQDPVANSDAIQSAWNYSAPIRTTGPRGGKGWGGRG